MKKVLYVLLCVVFLLSLSACMNERERADLPQNTNQIPSAERLNSDLTYNPIDGAFARIIDERGAELADNTIFAYLYALKWYNAYYDLSKELLNIDVPATSIPFYCHQYQLIEAVLEYAEMLAGSNQAAPMFFEIAGYYRMLTFGCLVHSPDLTIQADEEELYQYLSEVNFDESISYDIDIHVLAIRGDEYNPLHVFATLPDEDIFLAFAPPFGAVLSVKGEKYFYAWSSGELTPRLVLPQLHLYDYNGDGADELAVILYVGSGTGIAITELHIVDIYGSMYDLVIRGEMIEELLYHRLSASYDQTTEMVTLKLDEQSISVDTSKVDKEVRKDFLGLGLGSIVHFSEENGSLKVHISIGLCGFDWAIPFDYVDFFADININEARHISLSNCYVEYIGDY